MPEREGGFTPDSPEFPEIQPDELERTTTDRGHRETHTDTNGRLDFEREYYYADDAAFEKGDYRGYEKQYAFNEAATKKAERGKDVHRDNSWEIQHELAEDGSTIERTGEVTSGSDRGHRWRESYHPPREAVIVFNGEEIEAIITQEGGEILDQGENPNKEPTGHTWTKWQARRKDTGEYLTHWGEKATPKNEGEPEYGEWGNPPEVMK